jgi:hypothetical protein
VWFGSDLSNSRIGVRSWFAGFVNPLDLTTVCVFSHIGFSIVDSWQGGTGGAKSGGQLLLSLLSGGSAFLRARCGYKSCLR